MKGHVLIATHVPPGMAAQLNELVDARLGVPRAVLVREGIKLLLEREELKRLEEEVQHKAKRAAIEASAA